jgi:hypothetical protein
MSASHEPEFEVGVPTRAGARAGWITGGALLLALAGVAAHYGDSQRFLELARSAHPLWLGAALALQVATYACAAGVWQRSLDRSGTAVRLRDLLPLGVAKLFVDQALPSAGLSGTVLVLRSLHGRGVPRGFAMTAMLVGLVSFYVAYAIAVAIALAILARLGEVHRALLALALVFALLAAGVPLAVLWLRGRAALMPGFLLRLPFARETFAAIADAPPGALLGARLGAETTALQLAIFALDAATLAVMLHALVTPAAPDLVFASFVVASLVATLAWVPGGLGTFEGTCVAMLHVHGVELEAAIGATLLLRGFTFWLPMAPGSWIARHEMLRRPPAS